MTDKEKDEYPISPMHKHLKEVVVYLLSRERAGPQGDQESGPVHRMKWVFQPQDFPCNACHSSEHIKFMVLPTGVYRFCDYEGCGEKVDPVNYEDGQEAILLEDIVCTDPVAKAVLKMYSQEKIYLDPDAHIFLPEYKLPRHPDRKPRKAE